MSFGYEFIEYIAGLHNCEIEIIDTTKEIRQKEVVEDFVQVMTVFSCKFQGKQAKRAREIIKELAESQ